jgi:hypothetical protein
MNFDQFPKIDNSKKEVVKTPEKETKEGVDFVFEKHPELLYIGDKESYSSYIETIFPESKAGGIFYHGGKKGIEEFRTPKDLNFEKNNRIHSGTRDYGVYFTADKSLGKYYARSIKKEQRDLYPVLLNIKNPYETNAWFAVRIRKALGSEIISPQSITEQDYQGKLKGHDSIIWHGIKGEVVVFDSEQIHILGSQEDIEGFKEFVSKIKV